MSIAVPGQLHGMLIAHERYGRLNWTQLIEPAINLSKEGIRVTSYLEKKLMEAENEILSEKSLRQVFVNNETGKLYKKGEILKRPKLTETLIKIAKNPHDFYEGEIASNLVHDVNNFGINQTIEFMTYIL